MTPFELRERRRDRALRRLWLQQKRIEEIAKLKRTMDGIHNVKATFPDLSEIFDLAINKATEAVDALERIK